MPLTPAPIPTVAVFHGDGNITQYHPDADGVTVHESAMRYDSGADVRLEFRSIGTSHLRHTLPLRDTLTFLGLPDPYTPAALEAAWENAEQADKCLEGDVLITHQPLEGGGGFKIAPARSRGRLNAAVTRILSRAPREPWQDLADALRGTVWERLSGDVDGLAAAVHAAGWRKTGGEEA